ncbi:MAG TPA: ATP-binding protein [Dehalococcoidia bacterium]|nr:ATP-binding protein [Dehalococcoidia bacterium]
MSVTAWLRTTRGGLLIATALTAALVGVLEPFRHDLGLANVGFSFLILTLLIASTWGRAAGLYAAVVTNLAYNFFFIEPLHQFNVHAVRDIGALVLFLGVSVIGSTLLATARESATQARRRQAETEVALRLSRAMGGQSEPEEALRVLCSEVTSAFAAPGAAVLTRVEGGWSVLAHAGASSAGRPPSVEERAMVDRAASEGRLQGLGSTGLEPGRRGRIVVPRGRDAAYSRERTVALVPLKLGERIIGVLRVDGPIGDSPFRDEPAELLTAVASEAAVAVQRSELAHAAAHAEALQQADEMKTALMASISHDLKTPLAGIKAAISSILDKQVRWSEEDLDAFHATIDSQVDRLNRVISDILDLNRIEAGDLQPEQAPLRARDLLDRAREVTAYETKGREVTLDAPADLRLMADESLITQALVNLIENAVKYSTHEGAIHLTAAREGDSVVLGVADEGPGIAPQDLPYVFERFYRAEEHSRRVKGSGLGLTVVKGFVELCGGSVGVESSPKGTRFSIRLPAAAKAKAGVQ